MATMPEHYYNNFDPAKTYDRILYRDGYTLQGAELNEAQSASNHRLKGVADAMFLDGDIVRDAQISINAETGFVKAGSGAVYLNGAVRGVPSAEFTVPTSGTIAIGIRLTERTISELDDPSLYNPAIGSRGEGEPGAWRLQITPAWSWDGDGGSGEFYPVYVIDDGEVRAKEPPPSSDAVIQSIAKYDRDSTAGGSYVVNGLTVLQAADDDSGNQIYTLSEGRARVNGYGVDIPASRRLLYPAKPDLRVIDTEVHVADSTSMAAGGQRITLAHPPLYAVDAVRITSRKTVTLTHGSYSGASDALPDTSIVAIVECRQNTTVYVQGTDYKKNGDKVDWSLSGAEMATGSTYQCTYDYITTVEIAETDFDGFSVEGAVSGSSILVTYQQAIPRIDRLAIAQDGQSQWFQGVAAEMNARAPEVPGRLLPIATVHQTWRETRRVVSDGVRVVPFDEIETINRRIDYALQEIARQRLEADIFTREAGARVGIFVDPLLNDDMRDQGLEQSAAIVDGDLTLPITAVVLGMPDDIKQPLSMKYSHAALISQTLRTSDMKVNPYMAFGVLPATITLTPAVDFWTETQSQWTSPVTQWFGSGNTSSTSVTTQQVGTTQQNIEYLRPIRIAFLGEGFGPGEILKQVTFDGIKVAVNPA